MNIFQDQLHRLEVLKKRRPQYAEIYDFYTGLCRFFNCQKVWLTCIPDMGNLTTRSRTGFPLLTGAALNVHPEQAKHFFTGLIENLKDLGQAGQEELQQLTEALESNQLPLEKLLVACLEKERAPLVTSAEQLCVSPALLEYICSLALSAGLRHWREEQPLALTFDGWQEGYCPLCGGSPAMGELTGDEGRKRLHCAVCATSWEAVRLCCSYCGNKDRTSLEYFTADGETGYRVDVCRKCNSYLKVVDSREVGAGLPMDVEDLNTMHLDLLAQNEGFSKGKRSVKD